MSVDAITDKILLSAKYKVLDPRVVRRIVMDTFQRFGAKRAEAEAKRLLHQTWALYYGDKSLRPSDDLSQLLALHQSTRERLPFVRDFYEQIFALTGRPESIADYACGLNSLAFTTLGYDFPSRYQAFDIDCFTVQTLNDQFRRLGLSGRFTAELGDLLLDPPMPAEMTLLLKVLPCLELQQKGASRAVLGRQVSRFVVVSYPLKSVSGRERGMENFYQQQFTEATQDRLWRTHELVFPTELVFVIDRQMNAKF